MIPPAKRPVPAVTEEEPFGPEVVVYKVMGKMFALVDYDSCYASQ